MRVVIERRAEERAQKFKLLQEKSQYQNEALQLGMSSMSPPLLLILWLLLPLVLLLRKLQPISTTNTTNTNATNTNTYYYY